ncbi:MAG: alpha-amylase family glycosyl hydrolase [Erysipelotrichaceae bacterium]
MQKYLVNAYLDSYDTITIEMNKDFFANEQKSFQLVKDDKLIELPIIDYQSQANKDIYHLQLTASLDFAAQYSIMTYNAYLTPLIYRFVVKTAEFQQQFYYDGNDLGAIVKNGKTTFKLWAPTADKVWLVINDKMYKMNRGNKGVYSLCFDIDLTNIAYNYLVSVNGMTNLTIDPYGKCQKPNSTSSIVTDNTADNSVIRKREKDLIIYEVSVRDYSKESTFQTMSENLDYLAKLGVNVIQLLPVNDFAGVNDYFPQMYYNWGYNPVSYQSLKQSYSSNINDCTAVNRQFKQLVDNIHQNEMLITLDVVFNHHYNASDSCFEKIVPYYYFRFENGDYSVKGGCGAEFDSKQAMCRKYFIDTLEYFTRYYDIDGFRFDLMGFLDVETMNQIASTLKQIKPYILLYGEGWVMESAEKEVLLANHHNRELMKDYAFFDDEFRDCFKGNTFDYANKGYLTGNYQLATWAEKFFKSDRHQFINYVQCHDNMTCFDKIRLCCPDESSERQIARQKLLLAAVLFSRGISFISAGQEFCISKDKRDNCYNAPDYLNNLSNHDKTKYQDVIDYTASLIAIKKEIELNDEATCKIFAGLLLIKNNSYELIFNPKEEKCKYSFHDSKRVIFDGKKRADYLVNSHFEIDRLSFVILKEEK